MFRESRIYREGGLVEGEYIEKRNDGRTVRGCVIETQKIIFILEKLRLYFIREKRKG